MNILALLHAGTPGRQAPLLSKSGASRTAFAQSLSHLVDLGLLERNPGHGHPLRPEYRLTPKGVEIAAVAGKINAAVTEQAHGPILRRTWSVPVLAASYKPRYFGEIKNELVSVTDRALSQSLQQLQKSRWLVRNIDTSKNPPRPIYQAANQGFEIAQAINLARV
ncbi:winged helix-turn-helix transcriptional regulator [Maritalea sp.]|uniref:winged helix-turn-helix transcriptional regulator n=1 Tax=Maritalea sp. TaxID=2003361 RepID=UPI003EFB1E26